MGRLLVFLAIVCAALFESANARATCCNTDADCPPGVACSDGACDAVTRCTCDTDCGPSLYCVPDVITVCSGSTAQDCHSEGRCASAWQRPCETAADCGPGGFTCVANGELCSASGCQTTAKCTPPTLPDTCATDSDCPTAWTCEPDTALMTACIPAIRHCPLNGCPPLTGAKSCVPPLFDLVGPSSYAGPPVSLPKSCSATGVGAGGDGQAAGGAGGGAGGSGSGQTRQSGTAASSSGGCEIVPGAPANPVLLLGALGLLGASLRHRARRSRRRVGATPPSR